MATAPAFTHRGVGIHLTPTGAFKAVLNGSSITCPSLSAMKAKIDKASAFPAFKALSVPTWEGGDAVEVLVTGVKVGKARRYHGPGNTVWLDSQGREHGSLYPATEATLEAAKAHQDLLVRHADEKEALRMRHAKEEREAKAKLVPIPFPDAK